MNKGLDIHIDADFSGSYDKDMSDDPASVYYRSGFVIKHADYPATCKSKLKTEIVLSTTEVEHVVTHASLKGAMPTMNLL